MILCHSTCILEIIPWIIPSLPYFLPSPFLMCCAILQTSFGGNGPIWGDDWSHSFHRRSPNWSFPGLSSAVPGDLCTVSGIISLSPISLSDRLEWRDTQGKWPLARNPDRSWWHRRTCIKLFLAAAHVSIDNGVLGTQIRRIPYPILS